MLKYIQQTIDLNLQYVRMVMADMDDAQMSAQPMHDRAINHPAWVLGHLCVSNCVLSQASGGPPLCPDGWRAVCDAGTRPVDDRSVYPGKAELLETFERSTHAVAAAFAGMTDEQLERPGPAAMQDLFPTIGQYIIHDLTAHTGMHLGQIATWRRLMGKPPLF